MLVQHFFPPSSVGTHNNSSISPSSSSASSHLLKQNKRTSIHSPFFNSESTGFQTTIDQNIRMGCTDNIKTHMSAWPRKLTSVMETHRQRFSQLNQRFKQQQQQRTATTLFQPVQTSHICPIILPTASRPQPRQQARSKQHIQNHFPPAPTATRRSNTAFARNQPSSFIPDRRYITLANLTKILHVLQTQEKANDSDTATDTSTSTTNTDKQRVQQHLQETATRWWKPTRSSDSYPVSSTIHTSAMPTQLPSSTVLHQSSDDYSQSQSNLPLLV
jgi:hypothetical protein